MLTHHDVLAWRRVVSKWRCRQAVELTFRVIAQPSRAGHAVVPGRERGEVKDLRERVVVQSRQDRAGVVGDCYPQRTPTDSADRQVFLADQAKYEKCDYHMTAIRIAHRRGKAPL